MSANVVPIVQQLKIIITTQPVGEVVEDGYDIIKKVRAGGQNTAAMNCKAGRTSVHVYRHNLTVRCDAAAR